MREMLGDIVEGIKGSIALFIEIIVTLTCTVMSFANHGRNDDRRQSRLTGF